MRALVTGAAGFVGSWVVKELLREGIEVRAFVRPQSDLRNLQGLQVELAYGDLRQRESVDRAVRGCQMLFHVAAFYSAREADAPLLYEINVGGTRNVLEAALEAGVEKVVHTSTIGTIGRPAKGGLPDESVAFNLWDTASHYVKSKYLAERLALAMARRGLPVVVVNPCAPVGPGDLKPSPTGRRIVDYLRGKIPPYPEGGINFIAVEDVARGHLLAAEKGRVGERYILGHQQGNLSRRQFLSLMERVSGIPRPREGPRTRIRRLFRGKTRGHSPPSLTADPSKALRELGLPQTPLEEAFARAVQWFVENGYAPGR